MDAPQTTQETKQRKGCLYYGCIMGLILALMLVVGLLVGLRYAKKMLTDYTESVPTTLPAVQMDPEQTRVLMSRVDNFSEQVRAGKPVPTLELTGNEINALIAKRPELKSLQGKVYVTVESNAITGQVSFPMEELGVPMFKGRYLNGKGTFNLTFRGGVLRLTPDKLEVKGKPLPKAYMERIRKQNLASDYNADPQTPTVLEHLQDIEVKDGKLIIVPKVTSP